MVSVNQCKVLVTSEGFGMVITSNVYMNGMAGQLVGSSVGKFVAWGRATAEGNSLAGVICWTSVGGLGISTSDTVLICVLLAKYV
jgi:hypothetical protein